MEAKMSLEDKWEGLTVDLLTLERSSRRVREITSTRQSSRSNITSCSHR